MDLTLIILLILGWFTLGAVGIAWIYHQDRGELKLFSFSFIAFSSLGLTTLFCATFLWFISFVDYGIHKILEKFPKANITIVKSRK